MQAVDPLDLNLHRGAVPDLELLLAGQEQIRKQINGAERDLVPDVGQRLDDIVRLRIDISHIVAVVLGLRLDHGLLELADEVLQIRSQVLHSWARREGG